MTKYKWVMFNLVLAFVLVGCFGNKPEASAISSLKRASWCTDFNQPNGLPVDNQLENSHILYKTFPLENEGNGADEVWAFSVKNGSNDLLSDESFPQPESKYGQYDKNGNGFLLNSSDERHIAIWGQFYGTQNADGTYSLIIRDKVNSQDVDIFHTSPAENVQGAWSPDGNHFVFTSYKNSDKNTSQYYSLVYAINSDGTDLRELVEQMSLETLERPRWSPDSQKIAIPVRGKDGGMHILIINFQTGNVARYKISPMIRLFSTNYEGWVEQNEMAWSPDSHWFAYISEYEHNGIEILNTESGKIYCVENEKVSGVDKIIWLYDSQ